MFLTNWLKAGRTSKKKIKVIPNYHFQPKGQIGDAKWDDYIQISFYDKETGRFVRLQMTVEEATKFKEEFESGLRKFKPKPKPQAIIDPLAPESQPYKCRGCDNLITWAELCDDCAGSEISMARGLDPDNHEYMTRTEL